jgi:rifamycin polyketide synthase module 1/2/3|tara:strand:- start:310 stop:1017 length:708 start_codon:yes stop_codon:yes gene_type:complete
MSSGDHLSSDVIGRFRLALPETSIYTVYGLTEVGGRLCVLSPEMADRIPGSVGQPIPGMKIKVLDEGGRLCSPNVTGDVYVAGDWLFDGYHRDEGATKESLGSQGLKTGDLGLVDDNGFLYLRGRSDDVFKSSGKKVSSLIISDALLRTEFFEDVAVMAQPHPVVGHVPHVYFVPQKNIQFDRGAIVRHLRKLLPADHIPQGFTEVPAIPRTGSGKVIRIEMLDLAGQFGPASDS